jgi:putative phage-type endonuclease
MKATIRRHEWQGSPEWQDYRSRMGNASELAALMDCSPWFPHTPHELWLLKSRRAERTVTPAMRRGLALEARARAFIEQEFDMLFEPQVMARERISASLDGLSFDGQTVLEIKCPAQGLQSELWQHVEQHGRPPEHYWWQVQQGLFCSGAASAHFVVCHAEGDEIVSYMACEVKPDPMAHEALTEAWEAFFQHLDEDRPPPLTGRDTEERVDTAWRDAVSAWKEARMWLEEARRAESAARAALIEAAGHRNVQGSGVKLTRYFKRGEIDWKRATAGQNLEHFRKEGSWHFRISEQE